MRGDKSFFYINMMIKRKWNDQEVKQPGKLQQKT